MADHEDELRADLQQFYGIDLDAAMSGGHSPIHIAALFVQLPQDSRIARAIDPDNRWTLTDVLLATIANALHGLIWGLGDERRRGRRPEPIGPTWMTKGRMRSLPARVLPVSELMRELAKPRRTATIQEVTTDGR